MKIRQIVWQHIRENAKEKGIFIDFINGYSDHCHCLVSMGVDQSMQQIMKLIKGESSYWINKHGILSTSAPPLTNVITPIFEWQEEYYAASVSASSLSVVRNYIRNQEAHHAKKSFQYECDEFIINHELGKYLD
jgi:REP element-mobilizing transposase RayT